MYVFAVYASHVRLNDLWTNMCGLVSTCGTCFWDCRSVHVQRSVKSVMRVKCMYYIERVSWIWVRFRTAQNARIWSFLKKTTCYICYARCCCCSLVLIVLDTDFTALWLHLCSLSSLPFLRQAPSSSLLPSQFLPFCHRKNETASATTALRTINLPKCTQLFVNKVF